MSSPLARLALVLYRQTPGIPEERLGRILTFFGVPWQSVALTELVNHPLPAAGGGSYVVFGSVDTLGALTSSSAAVVHAAAALYAYATEDREASIRTLSTLAGGAWTWSPPAAGAVPVVVTTHCPELTGPMSGIQVEMRLSGESGAVIPGEGAAGFVPIVSVDGAQAFLRCEYDGVPLYFCASTAMVDIDAPVRSNFYDVKDHFLAAVPLVMFVTSVFRDVMWRPQELGACLIIDDPLLKTRYGFCDFPRLRDSMRQYGFTTNIAFIPWNWRRTTTRASEFFRSESDLFSVSIHGCDHTAGEFGSISVNVIDQAARLAQVRMGKHQARTQIQHDPVMVFPQGVFSSTCPAVLKLNGFVAAINTEISPVDRGGAATVVRDAWDVAILRYGSFPIFTRRYPHHGLENFAFDLLLGKPCLIVAHHEFFKEKGARAISLVEKLTALNTHLRWRSPREVIRRAYRRRRATSGQEQIEMYGNELSVANAGNVPLSVTIRKQEVAPELVSKVEGGGHVLDLQRDGSSLLFGQTIAAGSEVLFKIIYEEPKRESEGRRSLSYEAAVATRRLLSEFRDEYVQTTRLRGA